MNVNKRKTGEHVEWEPDDWRSAFFLDMRILDILVPLAADLQRAVQALPPSTDESKGEEDMDTEQSESKPSRITWPQIHGLLCKQAKYILKLTREDGIEWKRFAYRMLYGPLVRISSFLHRVVTPLYDRYTSNQPNDLHHRLESGT